MDFVRACGAALATTLAVLAHADPSAAACADVFRFEADARLDVMDIAALGRSIGPEYPLNDRVLVVREFRPTARPTQHGWTGLALMYATTDGVPVDTVGGVLWTRKPQDFAGARATAFTTTPKAQEARFANAACPGGFVIRLDEAGRVTAGGKAIGVVLPEPAR